MKTPTDQKDLRMLAEKVMRWRFIEWVPDGLWFKAPEREMFVSTADNSDWNPFANPADAVLLMEAADIYGRNLGLAIEYGSQYHVRIWSSFGDITGEVGTDFPRVLATAITCLVKKRPELFEVTAT